jgi:hypothetical protein
MPNSALCCRQVQLPPWALALQPGVNADYHSQVYRLTLSSPVTPGGIFDCHLDTGRLELLQWQGSEAGEQEQQQQLLLLEALGAARGSLCVSGSDLGGRGTRQEQDGGGEARRQCLQEAECSGQGQQHQQGEEGEGWRQNSSSSEHHPLAVPTSTAVHSLPAAGGGYYCQQLWVPAHDGVQVPMTVMCKGEWTGPRPVLVLVYGAYGEVSRGQEV